MPGCAALGCNNRSEKGFMMKCFPRDPVLRQIWKERVGRSDWEPSNNSFLCQMHFERNQWVVLHNGRVKLKKGALPTIFMVTSTRRSSKKRGVSESDNGENVEEYLTDYLQNHNGLDETSNPNTLEQAMVKQGSSQHTTNDNIYITYNEDNIEKIFSKDNFIILGNQNQVNNNPSSTYLRTEVKKELSNDDYLQIEKRLKLVCDGEKFDDLIDKRGSLEETSIQPSVNDSKDAAVESDEDFFEQMDEPPENVVASNQLSSQSQQSKFTIKISGVPEDIYEITQIFGPPVNGLKPSLLGSTDFVTSEIVLNYPKIDNKTNNLSQAEDSSPLDDLDRNVNSPDHLFVNELLEKCKSFEAKMEIQQQLISTLSEQSIKHKDVVDSMRLMETELKRKDAEIDRLKGKTNLRKGSTLAAKKSNEKVDAQTEVDEPLLYKITSKINQLEMTNKQLMKSLNSEVEKRRKAEYQVRDRENKIKELNWKLDKASKFYERSERNMNTYRRKLSTLQTLLRRKNIMADKKQTYEKLQAEQQQESFSKPSLTAALSILKACGHRGYAKLLSFNFPLPTMDFLLQKNEYALQETGAMDVSMEVVDKEGEGKGLASGTVQDIFNESSDGDYMVEIDDIKKYVSVEDNPR